MPKVSVIIAVYNIEQFVRQCINSVINQDHRDLEIIVVDDCSKDSSGQICDEFTYDERVKVIHHECNKGISCVRNTGLDNSCGDYIVFVDGDDWLASDFVSYMLSVITQTHTDMAINLVNFTTRDNKQVQESSAEIWDSEKATYELLFPKITIGAWNKIYRRDFIERNRLRFRTNLFMGEGLKFITDAAQRCENIGVGCRKAYYYRLNNANSATTRPSVKHNIASLTSLREIEQGLVIRTPLIYEAMRRHTWLNHFHTVCSIIITDSISEYREQYRFSRKYMLTYMLDVMKDVSIYKKLQYIFATVFPVTAARVKNYIFQRRLKADMRKHEKCPPPLNRYNYLLPYLLFTRKGGLNVFDGFSPKVSIVVAVVIG